MLALTACGGANASYAKEAAYEMPMMDYAVAETAASSDYDYDNAMGSYGYEEAEEAVAGAEAPAPEVQDTSRKLIKNVYLTMETKTYAETTAAIKNRIAQYGGYIESANETTPSVNAEYRGSRYMNITARIPSRHLDEFVNGVEASGNVTYKDENVRDITLQYSDTEARRNSLKVEQDRLNDLMKQAETVEDLITIESRLSEVRYELESIESRLRTFDNQVDYSTVTMSINEVTTFTPVKEATFGERISEGFKNCVEGMTEFFEDLIVFIIANSPLLIFLAILAIVIVSIVKRAKKNKPARLEKKARREAEKAAKKAAKAAAKAEKAAAEVAKPEDSAAAEGKNE